MEEEVSSEEQETTPSPEESESQPESAGAETQEAAPEKEQEEEAHVPFHKHPRFQEVIEQNRAYKSDLDQTRGYLEAMQRELQAMKAVPQAQPKPNEPKYKQLIDNLKTVNPEFAQFQEDMIKNLEEARQEASAAKEVQKRLEAYEQREFQTNAMSRLNNLYETNKVPEVIRKRYDREVRSLAYELEVQGKRLQLKDIDSLFKSVHEEYTPFLESLKRETLKGYVQGKKSDSIPAPATGGAPAVSGAKKIQAGDQEGMIKWLAKGLRDAKKI